MLVWPRAFSYSLEDAIRKQDTPSHSLNDNKLRFQRAEHDPRAVEIRNDVLIETFRVL